MMNFELNKFIQNLKLILAGSFFSDFASSFLISFNLCFDIIETYSTKKELK